MRLFIALRLTDQVRQALVRTQEAWKRAGLRGRYTPPENLHLTLAFLGELPDPDPILEVMEGVAFDPIPLRLEGAGRFGTLWWAGLSPSGELDACVRRLRRALAQAEVPFDRKRFSPHITLVRQGTWPDGFSGEVPAGASMTAHRLSLMRSDRGKGKMIYTEIGAVFPRKED